MDNWLRKILKEGTRESSQQYDEFMEIETENGDCMRLKKSDRVQLL